jgi:nitrate reductase gamma subunit
MEQWIHFAKGPLFAFTFLIMILGLTREVVIQVYSILRHKGRRIANAPWRRILAEAATWVVPVRHLIPETRVFSTVSYLFHIGVIAVPIFLAGHIAMWERLLNVKLPVPRMGRGAADFLTLFTIASVLVLFGYRSFSRRLRSMSHRSDYVLLILILAPFATGYAAMHPAANPFPWPVMMLAHLLSAELLFLVIPFTKLAHIVLFFFDRVSVLHWQLQPGAGSKVAKALYGEEARV